MKQSYDNIDDFIEDIHEELSIKDMVLDLDIFKESDFRGELVSCCFHDDKTPSLQISDRFFRCYSGSCGVKGDAISFIRTYYNTGFIEALRKIAEIYNINIDKIRFRVNSKVSSLRSEWESYLYNMDKADGKIQNIRREYFPQEIGYDKQLGYIVLPLTSKTGTVLGFTKRRIDFLHDLTNKRKYKPKWRHSSIEHSLINQCQNLFNLHNSANPIRVKDKAIITEGPKDVIAFRRVGIEYVVGVCGTTNSNNIWDLILPVKDIYLSMDNDEAGIKTVLSNVKFLSSSQDIEHIHVLIYPEEKDPYDVLIEEGKDKLLEIYESPVSSLKFFVKNGSRKDVLELYEILPDHSKLLLINEICKQKYYSVNEVESWLFSNVEQEPIENINEKELLISVMKGEHTNSTIKPDKAKRILKIKYGIEI